MVAGMQAGGGAAPASLVTSGAAVVVARRCRGLPLTHPAARAVVLAALGLAVGPAVPARAQHNVLALVLVLVVEAAAAAAATVASAR